MIRSVYVTPLNISPQRPTMEIANRVIREYTKHRDRFIRVTFMDEGFSFIGPALS